MAASRWLRKKFNLTGSSQSGAAATSVAALNVTRYDMPALKWSPNGGEAEATELNGQQELAETGESRN